MKILKCVLFIFALIIITTTANALTCEYVNGSCSTGYTEIFRASDVDDAHAQTSAIGTYDYRICCKSNSSITNNCSATQNNTVALLSSADNAHIQDIAINTYTNAVCISGVNLSCIVENASNCSADYTCLYSLSDLDNAHISNCSKNYNHSMCCKERIETCVTPYNNLYISGNYTNTILCPGTYYINDSDTNGVIIITGHHNNLTCNGTKIISSTDLQNSKGIAISNGNNSVFNCYVENYYDDYSVFFNGNLLKNCTAVQRNHTGSLQNHSWDCFAMAGTSSAGNVIDGMNCTVDVTHQINYVASSFNSTVVKNSRFENLNPLSRDFNTMALYFNTNTNISYNGTILIYNNTFINYYRAIGVTLNYSSSNVTHYIYDNFFYNNTFNIFTSNNLSSMVGLYNITRNYYDDICDRNITDENNDGYGDAGSEYPYSAANNGKIEENLSSVLQDFAPVWPCSSPASGGGGHTYIDIEEGLGVRKSECGFWTKLWHSFLYIFGYKKPCYIREWAMFILFILMMVVLLIFLKMRRKKEKEKKKKIILYLILIILICLIMAELIFVAFKKVEVEHKHTILEEEIEKSYVEKSECGFWTKLWHSFLYIFGYKKPCYIREWAMFILFILMMVVLLIFLKMRRKKRWKIT